MLLNMYQEVGKLPMCCWLEKSLSPHNHRSIAIAAVCNEE